MTTLSVWMPARLDQRKLVFRQCCKKMQPWILCPRMLNWLHQCWRLGTTFAAPAVEKTRPPDHPELRAWSPVDEMRERLGLLYGLFHSTKERLWKRLLKFEEVALSSRHVAKGCRNKNESLQFFQYSNTRLLQKSMLMTRHIFRRTRGASFVKQASDDKSVIVLTCMTIESEKELWCSWTVFLNSTDEWTELEQEAWPTALVLLHIGMGSSCFASVENEGHTSKHFLLF